MRTLGVWIVLLVVGITPASAQSRLIDSDHPEAWGIRYFTTLLLYLPLYTTFDDEKPAHQLTYCVLKASPLIPYLRPILKKYREIRSPWQSVGLKEYTFDQASDFNWSSCHMVILEGARQRSEPLLNAIHYRSMTLSMSDDITQYGGVVYLAVSPKTRTKRVIVHWANMRRTQSKISPNALNAFEVIGHPTLSPDTGR